MLEIINIERYINELGAIPIIDVRSPAEFEKGHIPNAKNIPIFSNEERAIVGSAYKQESKDKAMELGLAFVQPKLQAFINQSTEAAPNKVIAIHCWRGGLRSKSFAQHLMDNGFNHVYLIEKGYKAFRNHVLAEFEKDYHLKIIGGYTGSAKTELLLHLKSYGQFQVIDLEGLANHKGSAFGGIGQKTQPTVEQFENNLFWEWKDLDLSKDIWIEDESRAIGSVLIPQSLYDKIRSHHVYFLDISREERAKHLVTGYGNCEQEALKSAISRISSRLGGLMTKNAMEFLESGNMFEVAKIALTYYDKYYAKGVSKRDKNSVTVIPLETTDSNKNLEKILSIAHGE